MCFLPFDNSSSGYSSLRRISPELILEGTRCWRFGTVGVGPPWALDFSGQTLLVEGTLGDGRGLGTRDAVFCRGVKGIRNGKMGWNTGVLRCKSWNTSLGKVDPRGGGGNVGERGGGGKD